MNADDFDAMESRLTAAMSERMLDLAALREGMRVLDVATGRGELALRAARRVGSAGYVLGIDIAETSLEVAREKVEREDFTHVGLRAANAETFEDAHRFDVAIARWGLMYMQAPELALAATRRALARNGVLAAAFWAEPERVSWTLPRRVTERLFDPPALAPNAPGPFRYATTQAIESDFVAAGFAIEHVEEAEVSVVEAESGAGIVAWARAVFPSYVRDLTDAQRERWEAELARESEELRSGPILRLGGVTRIVVARSTSARA